MQEAQQRAAAPPSAACLAVSAALDALGLPHERHRLSPDGFLVADILLPGPGVALLIEGPTCYIRNTGRRHGAPDTCVQGCCRQCTW